MAAQVQLNGFSRSERNEVISSASEAVQKGGGWIEDVVFFSNVAVNLRCVVMSAATARLMEELTTIGLGLTRDDMAALHRATTGLSDVEELRFSLQITFVHDEPEMRRHIPSVPG